MSMDEQFAQMQRFQDALQEFNAHLRESMRELTTCHDDVVPYWQDEMRRQYDEQWIPLDDMMKLYLTRESIAYNDFIKRKVEALRGYLNGN